MSYSPPPPRDPVSCLKSYLKPGLICVSIIFLAYFSRPLLWPGGTGISDTLDTIIHADIKRNKPVVSKTVEKDKQGKTIKTIETTKDDEGKTLWDWLSLLGVPLSLAILGYVLQEQQRKRADNETKEEVLQAYFDRLSVLLIDRNLIVLSNKSQSSTITPEEQELLDSSLDVIRARTLSILRRFENDAERKTSVIKFLIETEIVGKLKLNLSDADLSGVNLIRANLSGVNLYKVDLSGAKLIKADLSGAKLIKADLINTNFKDANLKDAKLSGADLTGADLTGANLSWVDLTGANLSWAKLIKADLTGAELIKADLSEAKLFVACLIAADLTGANLQHIECDSETKWPDKNAFTNAKNIPQEVKIQLDITP